MPQKTIRFTPFEVDLEQRELRRLGSRVPLQHKPFRILEILLRQPGALVSRQELAKELWPDLHVDFGHSLNSAVNSLRQALDDSPRPCRYIETRSGIGYRFIAPIEDPTAAPAAKSVPATSAPPPDDYLRGRFFLNKMTSDGIQRAIGCFQSALSEHPHCALAHSGLADCYSQLALSGTVCASDVYPFAQQSAMAAVTFQPDLPEAHLARGVVRMIFDWDWSRANDDWNRARQLNSSLPDVHRVRALFNAVRNRHDEALRDISQAQDLDPLSLPTGLQSAWLLYLARQFNECVTQSWKVLALESSNAPTQMLLGLAYQQLGLLDEAIIELENACVCSDRHPAAVASLGYVYGAAGCAEKAQATLNELKAESQRRYVSAYWFALIYAGLNQRCLALDALKSAFSKREPTALWLNVDPRLAILDSEPAFLDLRRDLR